MVDSVRNSPNLGGLTVHDQKSSNVSSGQASQAAGNGNAQAEIREKVEQGRYPIDLDAISSKLFESIQDAEG